MGFGKEVVLKSVYFNKSRVISLFLHEKGEGEMGRGGDWEMGRPGDEKIVDNI